MKKALALSLAIFLGAALGALAQESQDPKPRGGGDLKAGTVTRLDPVAKMLTLKATNTDGLPVTGSDAKELTVYWDHTTKLEGTLKEGELIRFRGVDKDGKVLATWIGVGKTDRPRP